MNKYLKIGPFIIAGLVLLLPGEVLNNLIINIASSGLVGFLITAVFDSVLISMAFLLWHFLGRKRDIILLFVLFGVFGLFIEWNVLSHDPSKLKSVVSQLAMFTYWGSIFLAPYMLILAPDVSVKTRKRFWKYLMLSPFVYILGPFLYYSIIPMVVPNPLTPNEYFSLAVLLSIKVFEWSLLALYIFYIPYFRKIWAESV